VIQLQEADLPVALINPRQGRDFAKADRGTSWLNSLQHKLFGVFERKSSMQLTPRC
jgi:hypothetical protein